MCLRGAVCYLVASCPLFVSYWYRSFKPCFEGKCLSSSQSQNGPFLTRILMLYPPKSTTCKKVQQRTASSVVICDENETSNRPITLGARVQPTSLGIHASSTIDLPRICSPPLPCMPTVLPFNSTRGIGMIRSRSNRGTVRTISSLARLWGPLPFAQDLPALELLEQRAVQNKYHHRHQCAQGVKLGSLRSGQSLSDHEVADEKHPRLGN